MARNKYNARRTVVDGITFDSAAEARRYSELLLRQKAGEIRLLELQEEFVLQDAFLHPIDGVVRKISYVADFFYEEFVSGDPGRSDNWRWVAEDVKGMITPVFRIKQRLFQKRYPYIHLRIVGK